MAIRDNKSKNLKKLEGKYIVFERYIDNGISMKMPGKLLKVNSDSLLIRQHDNGSGIDWKAWEEEVSIKDILYITRLNPLKRLSYIIKRTY